jgi:hypothetical protein
MADSDSKFGWVIPLGVAVVGTIGTIVVAVINKPPSPPPTPTASIAGKPVTSKGGSLEPSVDFSIKSEKPRIRIGNPSPQGIIEVSDLKLHWAFEKCPALEPASPNDKESGDSPKEFRYAVNVNARSDSKLLDPRTFSYAAGEIDEYYIDIDFTGNGIHHYWLEFKYGQPGGKTLKNYKTPENLVKECDAG